MKLRGACKIFFRSLSTNRDDDRYQARLAKIKQIYRVFRDIDRTSQEFEILSISGNVWEQYAKPFEWSSTDESFFKSNQDTFNRLDSMRTKLNHSVLYEIALGMQSQMTRQSIMIEGNTLSLLDVTKIEKALRSSMNSVVEEYKALLEARSGSVDPAKLRLPSSCVLLPNKSAHAVIEARNHLLTQHLALFLLAPKYNLTLDCIKMLHRLLMLDTPWYHTTEWGRTIRAGSFRTLPMQSSGYHLTVYPYPEEVPALMDRFASFVQNEISRPTFHPLMSATRIMTSFLHIHPFFDGNGRMGRLIMAIVMLKYGFIPIILQDFNKKEYIDNLVLAQENNPEELYRSIGAAEEYLLQHASES